MLQTILINKQPIYPVSKKQTHGPPGFSPGDKPVICASLLCYWPTLLNILANQSDRQPPQTRLGTQRALLRGHGDCHFKT